MSFPFLFFVVCLEAGQDFMFFLFAELGRSLERLFPAVKVMDVETLGAAFVSPGCPKYTETGDFLPAAGALERLGYTVYTGGVRLHWRSEEGQVLDLVLTDIRLSMGDSRLQSRFSAAKYAVAEEFAIHFPALVNSQEPAMGAASIHAADAFPLVHSIL